MRSKARTQDRNYVHQQRLAEERRLQVAGALLLGGMVLLAIVFRAGIHTVFPPGWWRHL